MQSDVDRLKADYARRDAEEGGDADRKRLSWIVPENHLLDVHIQRFLFTALSGQGWTAETMGECRLLDVGCGKGRELRWFYEAGIRNIHAIELIESRAKIAQEQMPFASVTVANMEKLPYADKQFDCAVQLITFSSCLDKDIQQKAAKQMLRVTKNEGAILWVDLKPGKGMRDYIQGIGSSELKLLFPDCDIEWKYFGPRPLYLGVITSILNQGFWRSLLKLLKIKAKNKNTIRKSPMWISTLLPYIPGGTCYLGAVIKKRMHYD